MDITPFINEFKAKSERHFNIMGERSMSTLRRFVQDDSGATAIEYGLIAALVSVAIIAVLSLVGNNLEDTFNSVANGLNTAAEQAEDPAP
jgi:pilus assembly protein Flp/PilA